MSTNDNPIDEALVPFHEMLAGLIPLGDDIHTHSGPLTIESLNIEMPIELDVVPRGDGTVMLGSSPPLYYLETGYAPVLHQVKITLQREDTLTDEDDE